MFQTWIKLLESGKDLDVAEIPTIVDRLVADSDSTEEKARFLSALARKGETELEISSFAKELLRRSVEVPVEMSVRAGGIMDVCGTGGNRLNTFNISTCVGLVIAAAGVHVAKHGNRAITSACGSADVLEALGIRIDWSPTQAAEVLKQHGFVFLFAPHYHPAFRFIGPARKLCAERGQRTLFNFLGPLLNPARVSNQILGVSRPELCEPLAHALQGMGLRRGMVVCGQVGEQSMDELSILGPSSLAEFYHDRGFSVSTIQPQDFGIAPCKLEDLAGGNKEQNAAILVEILLGRDRGPRRDAVVLNSGAALLVAGRARSIVEGMEIASEVIDGGSAQRKLEALRTAAP